MSCQQCLPAASRPTLPANAQARFCNMRGPWRVVDLTECETESGKLLFHVQSYGRGFRMKLKFSRTQVNDQQINLYYFDQISIPADHVISQGLFGSGCTSYKLDSEQQNDFQGYFLCTITKDGIQTQFSSSLKCKHLLKEE